NHYLARMDRVVHQIERGRAARPLDLRHLRCLVRDRGKRAEVRKLPQIFRVELMIPMCDGPDSADGFPVEIKGGEQDLLCGRCEESEIFVAALEVAKEQWRIPVELIAARAGMERCAAA